MVQVTPMGTILASSPEFSRNTNYFIETEEFLRLQSVKYTGRVVISRKGCKIEMTCNCRSLVGSDMTYPIWKFR